jgi:hypothetical protein
MQRTLAWLLLLGLLGLVCACWRYRDGWEKALRDRASFEFQCPANPITIVALTDETYGNTNAPLHQGVTGCGKRGVYTATTSGYVSDSAVVQDGRPAPAGQ